MQNAIIVPSNEEALHDLNEKYQDSYIIEGYTDTIEEALEVTEGTDTLILTDIVDLKDREGVIYVGPDLIFLGDTKVRSLKNLKDSLVFKGDFEDGEVSEGSVIHLRNGYTKYLDALSGRENIFEPPERAQEPKYEELNENTTTDTKKDEEFKIKSPGPQKEGPQNTLEEPQEKERKKGPEIEEVEAEEKEVDLDDEVASVKTGATFEEPESISSLYSKIDFYFAKEKSEVEEEKIERPTELLEELDRQRETREEEIIPKPEPPKEEIRREDIAIKPPVSEINRGPSNDSYYDEKGGFDDDYYIGERKAEPIVEKKKGGFLSKLKGWING